MNLKKQVVARLCAAGIVCIVIALRNYRIVAPGD